MRNGTGGGGTGGGGADEPFLEIGSKGTSQQVAPGNKVGSGPCQEPGKSEFGPHLSAALAKS